VLKNQDVCWNDDVNEKWDDKEVVDCDIDLVKEVIWEVKLMILRTAF